MNLPTLRLGALLTFRGMMRDGDTLDNVRQAPDGGIYYTSGGKEYWIDARGDVYAHTEWVQVADRSRFRPTT